MVCGDKHHSVLHCSHAKRLAVLSGGDCQLALSLASGDVVKCGHALSEYLTEANELSALHQNNTPAAGCSAQPLRQPAELSTLHR